MYLGQNIYKKNFMKLISLVIVFTWLVQILGVNNIAFGAAPYTFKGYDTENITSETFTCLDATKSGTTITMKKSSAEGEAIGFISFDDAGSDIPTSIDLGSLEIDFSALTTVTLEGDTGSENDVPSGTIEFCSQGDYQDVISTVNLTKSDLTAASYTFSSNASIPEHTRSLVIHLYGTNTNTSSENTVVISNISLKVHDAAAPSCKVEYNTDWTNKPITVTVTASDADSGLEGIYKGGSKVSSTSPYTFDVSENTSFSVYSKDYAGKTSDTKDISVTNIDTAVPSAPASITLSKNSWTNQDVSVTLPELGTSSGAPEKYIYSINSGEWKDVPSDFKLSDTGVYNLSVKTADEAGNKSDAVSAVAYIDKELPVISKIDQAITSGSVTATVDASDSGGSGLDKIKYAQGSRDADYFSTEGTDITDNKFTVSSGGNYTVFVSDKAGNTRVLECGLNTAPVLEDITDKNTNEDTVLNVPLNVSDGETSINNLIITAVASDETLIPSVIVNQNETEASLEITPGKDLHGGPVTITVKVEDEGGEKVSDTFGVTVISINDAPSAVDDNGIETDEDKAITIDVLDNDSDIADGDTLTITAVGTPTSGTAVKADGKIVYTPNANFNGDDSFTYTISDGNGGTASATVSVKVKEVNDPPTAVTDTATTVEDNSVLIDVLANDTDPDRDTTTDEKLTLVSAGNGTYGTTTLEDGRVRYKPNDNYAGKDSFSYTIEDADHVTSIGTVKVTITGVNDPPEFGGLESEYTIDEDSNGAEVTFSIKDIETPANSLMLQAVSSDNDLLKNEKIQITGLADNEDPVTLKFTPEANQYGDTTITLTLGDGFLTTEDTFVLHVANVNDNPVAKTDTIYYEEDDDSITIYTSSLIANDTDIDGDTLSFVDIVSTTTDGTLEAADESKTMYYYYPKPNYDGEDSFTYSVTDGHVTVTGTCKIIAAAQNDPPVLTNLEDSYTTDEDKKITGITFNINDQESAPEDLLVNAGSLDTNLVSTDDITIVNNGDGTCSLSATPMPDKNGTARIKVTVSDGNLKTEKTVNIIITPVPDAPVAVDDYVYVPVTGSKTFDVLLNDRDVDGDTLTVVGHDASLSGTLTFDDKTQKFTYTARTGETGTSTFTYTISDGDPSTADATATVTLDVNTLTHAPSISPIEDRYINESGTTGGIIFTASDVDYGDSVTVSVSSANTALVPNEAENLVLTDEGDGKYSILITPVKGAHGEARITATVTDTQHNTVETSFYLYVYEVNDPPTAADDDLTTNEDTSFTLNMLANDSDPEGDSLYISDASQPTHGYVTRSGDIYTYHPYSNFNGTDSMTYWVTDGQSTSEGSVTIHVTPVNDNPTARDNWAEVPNDTGSESVTVSVLNNDYDVDGDTIKTYEIVTQGTYGTAVINENDTVTYTRTQISPNGNGTDSFVYRIIDRSAAEGDYRSATATVHIGVDFISSLYCEPAYITRNEDSSPYTLTLPITNPNNIAYTLSTGTSSIGTFEVIDNTSGNDTQVRFTPTPDANGSATVSYTVTGHNNNTDSDETYTSNIYVYLYPVNDPPVIDSAPESVSCNEEESAKIDYTFHDVDCDNDSLYLYAYAQNITSGGPIPIQVGISISRSGGTASVTVTPYTDTFGSLDIVVGVSDGLISDEETVHMIINPVDDAPRISEINKDLFEDTDVAFSVINPGTDVDGDGLIVSIADGKGPAHGTAVISGGTITYTPEENWYGVDTLDFTVTDDKADGLSSTNTAILNVISVNDPPVITGLDYYQETNEDTPKSIGFVVTDPDNDMTGTDRYTITSSNEDVAPLGGISITHDTGNNMIITVVPKANAYGKSVIGITANDGDTDHPLSAHAEFELTVISVNDIPVAQDDTASVDERIGTPAGTTSVTINVTANDSDVEDATLTVMAITNVSKGTVVNNKDGTVTYNVDGDYYGTATFDYTVMDKNGATDTATVTVTINPKNDPPTAVNDSATINEDQQIILSVLTNDSDPEGDTLSVTKTEGCAHGTAVANADGTITYTPNENYNGTDSFTYYISDGNEGTASAKVSITIKPVNDAPSISKHSSNSGEWEMYEDETKEFNFVVSDPETPVENLIIKIASLDETKIKTPNIKLKSVDNYKVITVTSEEDKNGVVPVQFKVSDGAITTTVVYNITIIAVNDPPVLNAPARITVEDTPISSSVTATDIDSDASSITFSKASDPSHGSVTVNADGTYTYTPEANWSGTDSFNVTVSDGTDSDTGTVVITVMPVNDPPTAVNDTVTTAEDTQQTIDVLENDIDVDKDFGDTLTVKSVGSASHGTTEIVLGEVKYTPSANWNGSDSFTYTISDGSGKTSSATVSVTVTPVNDTPSGGDDTAETDEDIPVTINATANDDIDLSYEGDTLSITSIDDPTNGTAVKDIDSKKIIYTPDADWNGTEEFYYTVTDSGSKTGTFKVTVTVNPVNDAPVIIEALPDVTIDEDGTKTVSFTVSDKEDTAASLAVTATHNNSTLLPALSVTKGTDGERSVVISPKLNKNGNADITITVTDSEGATGVKTFKFTVTPVNDVPVAKDDTAKTDENTPVTIDVLANDDVDLIPNEGDTLTLLTKGDATYGVVAIVNNKIVYTPDSSRDVKVSYTDTFTYTMQDASGATSGATVTVTVDPYNDPPTISDIANTEIQEDAADGTGDISFTVTDEEDDDDTLAVSVACSNTTLFPLANITVTNPAGGTGSERTVKAMPAANKFGSATITLTVRDSDGKTAADSFTVTVTTVNDIPANGDDAFTVIEDTKKQLDVLANDDPDYATTPEDFTVTSVDLTTYSTTGTVEIAADGKSVYYTSKLDDDKSDKFAYTMYDSKSTSVNGGYFTFVVNITITPINDAPVVTLLDKDGDGNTIASYSVNEGGSINGINFKVTDSDNIAECGITCEETVTVKSSNMILVLGGLKINNIDGSVNRTLDVQAYRKWNGTTTITITATDKAGLKGSASFTFIVNSTNDPPVAENDNFTIPEDATTKVNVLANDTDDDIETNADVIKVKSVVDNDPNAEITVSANGDGVNVKPNANYNGPVSFTYIASDLSGAESNSATVNVTVSQVNDAPVADDDSAVVDEDDSVLIDVLDGDTDIDQDGTLNADPAAEVLSASLTVALDAPDHGTVTIESGEIRYKPSANYNGPDTFEYFVVDASGAKDTGLVTVTVNQVNDDPSAVTDNVSTNEDTPLDIFPLANDTDIDTNTTLNKGTLHQTDDFSLTGASVDEPANGSIAIAGNKITYTPNLNYFGSDTITYTMSDGHGGSATGTINVTVNSVNDLPQFSVKPADMELTEDEEDGSSDFTVSDVETAGASLNVTVVSSDKPTLVATSDVTVTKGTDGERTVKVNPKNNQNGTAKITLRVTDAYPESTDYIFTVNVAAVNDDPVGNDKSDTINEDSSYSVDWRTLTSDVDIATNADVIGVTITTQAEHGTASVSGNNILYTPAANWNGEDSFVYTVTDKDLATDTGTITITVNQVNDAPVADYDSAVVNEDDSVLIDVLDGDTDIDQDSSLNLHPEAETLSISLTGLLDAPDHGTVSIEDGKVKYKPADNYNGTDSFEYFVVDVAGAKDTGLVNVTVNQVNDDPLAVTDNVETDEDTSLEIFPLENDTDVDTNESLNQGGVHDISDLSLTGASIDEPANGSITTAGNKITYTPDENYFGSDTITYTISDGHEGSATGTINVTVKSVNDLPEFKVKPADMELTEDLADGTSDFSVWDVETAGEDLNVTVESSDNPTLVATGDVTITKGTNGDRTVKVNPEDNQNGTAKITLSVTDTDSGSKDYEFIVQVEAVNDAPVAQDITDSIDEDTSYSVSWVDNTSDVDIATNGDTIGVTIEEGDGAHHGVAAVSGNNLTYTPVGDWNGVDTFTYTVTDSKGATDTGLVTITVNQVNDSPVAYDDEKTTEEDTSVDIFVLGNDTDTDKDLTLNANPDDEVLSISTDEPGLKTPSHGSITVDNDNNKIVYTPADNYNGTDTFEYNVDDGEALNTGLVTVTIKQVNDNPIAVKDSASVGNKTSVDIHVLDNDTDVDTDESLNQDVLHDKSTFSVTSYGFVGEGNGTLTESDGVLTFTPDLNYKGIQEITYTLSDGHGGTSIGEVDVTVKGENAPPVANDDKIKTDEDTPVTYNVIDNDTDVDIDDEISFVMFTEDTSSLPGEISAEENGDITFTPDLNYHGSFTIGYQIQDTFGETDTADITITVTSVNDTPKALDDDATTPEDTGLQIDVSGLISDADIVTDSDVLTVTVKASDAPQHGEYSVEGYKINYTPDKNWNGVDTLTYTVTDMNSASDTGVITITVDPVNDAPVAKADTATTNEDTPVSIEVLKNDTDIDTVETLNATPQLPLTVDEDTLGTPSHGIVSIEENEILYTPVADYNGPDSFTYRATDGEYTSEATVNVTVKQINDDPKANDDKAKTTDGDMVSINVLENDTDIDTLDENNLDVKHSLSDLRITGVSEPSNGIAVISGKKINYTAGATFSGEDSFTYTISDGHGGTDSAKVTVTVDSVNDPPETPLVPTPKEGDKYGGKSTINVTWSGFDIDGDDLTYTLEYYDGTEWKVITAHTEDTSYDFNVPESLTSITDLQFRVKAFDGEFYSDYGYSGHVSVDKDVPMNIVVRMTASDGRAYTAGTWINKSVTVTAVSVIDASNVTFSYGLDSKTYAEMTGMLVTNGVHNVYIKAVDEFENSAEFGPYLVKIDKQAPGIPEKNITVSGSEASVKFTLLSDPGNSGNKYILLPDGTKKELSSGSFTWTAEENDEYEFTIYDNAGNSTQFSVNIDDLDETPPQITCESGAYVVGQTSDKDITASLIFKDDESEIIGKGYAITENKAYSGIYQSYSDALNLGEGQHYIHAFAKNDAGLTTYETFGPFIVKTVKPGTETEGTVTGTPGPGTETAGPTATATPRGDVTVTPDEVTKGAKKIRIPGGEWSDTLKLEGVAPGTYLVEVMDENGNVTLMQLKITDEQIAAGVYQPAKADMSLWYMLAIIGLLLLLLILLLTRYNVKIEVCVIEEEGERLLMTIRKLKRKKREVTVTISEKDIRGSDFGIITLKAAFAKRMKGNTIIVEVEETEVLKATIPDDADNGFEARIDNWEEK